MGQLIEENRKCSRCQIIKPLTDFHKRKDLKKGGGGYRYVCKPCASERAKESYQRNKEKVIARSNIETKKRIKERREYVFLYLCSHPCVQCGANNPLLLEFDHIEREGKDLPISRAIYNNWSWKRLKDEISKCQVLCSNCHSIKTANENGSYSDLIEKYTDSLVDPELFLESINSQAKNK